MTDKELEVQETPADPVDKASQVEQGERTIAVRMVQDRLRPQHHPDFDGENCLECGAVMLSQRLTAGRIRCTECETAREKRIKLFGK